MKMPLSKALKSSVELIPESVSVCLKAYSPLRLAWPSMPEATEGLSNQLVGRGWNEQHEKAARIMWGEPMLMPAGKEVTD